MKLTAKMKNISREWLCTLIHMSEVDADIPEVPYDYGRGVDFGVREAVELLKEAETTEEWEKEIVNAISRRKNILAEDAVSDSEVINMAWVMGLKTVLVYARSIELSGGMDC